MKKFRELQVIQVGINPSKFHIINISKVPKVQTHHLFIPKFALSKKVLAGDRVKSLCLYGFISVLLSCRLPHRIQYL